MSFESVLRPHYRSACGRVAALVALLALGACASAPNKAPVVDRSPRGASAPPASAPTAPAAPASAAQPSVAPSENAGKPGFYSVRAGDTLIRIGLETGQNWRDLARWNAIENPNLLEVGQVLRVVAPGVDANAPAARGVAPTRVEARPLESATGTTVAAVPAPGAAASSSAAAGSAPAPAVAAPREDDVAWAWPVAGAVTTPFDEARSKGLVFAGKAGDPVLAAADGRVIYVGSGVRGYGNLVIVKHNNTYLTAYAHNQALLVKEDQAVRRGQKIAEMGSSDAERVQLHFEIRRLGRPIDPARVLPPR